MQKSSSVSQNDISSQTQVGKKNFGRFNVAETKVLEEKHKRTLSKETGGIVVVADQLDSEESSHINLSGRENKSEVEIDAHLSFSDHENRKRKVTSISPYMKRSGELSRTFEVCDEELGVNVQHVKGKTTIFKSKKTRRDFFPRELTGARSRFETSVAGQE